MSIDDKRDALIKQLQEEGDLNLLAPPIAAVLETFPVFGSLINQSLVETRTRNLILRICELFSELVKT